MLDSKSQERFWSKVSRTLDDACWEWQAACRGRGYGAFWHEGSMRQAHRVSLAIKLGRNVCNDKEACHTCDNPKCVNPSHLFEETKLGNMADMVSKGRHRLSGVTHCKRGHPYEDYLKGGYRKCKICQKDKFNEWQRKKRAERKATAALNAYRDAMGDDLK